ncbi:hypothetical protein LTR85_002095 [Meristemomyces frigidus]|nr:hypothetical protein LTR85_002095 [Meristemomyces frigidus]
MDDVEVAKKLVKDIRRAKHVDDPAGEDETAVDLTNALEMLSEELYSKPAHFILELIQNADDNRYATAVTPKLSLLYREDGYLWVGINELGFTEANVRAICRIAASTKKVENQQKGYIGEKGIGFKSVFKVADVVWVKSGAMSFTFDKNKPLGMIAPEWTDAFPPTSISERTMFCFKIPNQDDRGIVRANLLELKPELLIFLRQLRNIDVKVQNAASATLQHFSLSKSDAQMSGTRRTTLQIISITPRLSTVSDTLIVF